MTKPKEKKPAAPLTPAHTPSNSAAASANNSPFKNVRSLSPLKKPKKDSKGKKRNNANPITPPEPTTINNHMMGREPEYGNGSDEEAVERPAKKATEKHIKYKYTTEIQQMMFVFGEVADPLPETIMLIEDIVRSQVIEIIIQGTAQAQRRGSRHMNAEDLIFLIRHDRAKCNRLRTYLSWKDVRKNVKEASKSNDVGADEIMEAEDILGEPNADKPIRSRKKAIKLSWDLIGSYSDGLNDDDDDEEDETEVYKDTIQRLKDADEITRKMTREEYVHYSECRQASFTYRKAKRFREWANMATYVDMKPNDDIIDILGFLTFEMVNTLTDMGLAVKREEEETTGKKKRTRDEPEREGKGNDVDREEVGGSYCDESSEAQSPTKRQRAIKYESIFAPVPTGEMTTNSLFSAPPRERSPLQPFHLQEAFRRLQKQKQTAGNNFRGGLRRTKLGLI